MRCRFFFHFPYTKYLCSLTLYLQLIPNFLLAESSLSNGELPARLNKWSDSSLDKASSYPTFLRQNEFLKFKITYLGIIGGYSTLEVIHDQKDKNIIHLKLKAWTTPFVSKIYTLKMNLHSIVEKDSLQTLYYSEYKLERKRLSQHKIIVYPEKKQFNFYRNLEKTKPDDIINFTNRGYDTVASFYLSRCVDF